MEKLDDTLRAMVEEAERTEPDREIAVIVTVTKGTRPSVLTDLGFHIERDYASISAVSGRATAAVLRKLVALEEVRCIERDGEVRAS
ncbi:hypothetical protein [Alkalilimnicola ehrlichii]|nr:hypothetical protein [Alkalilimnicola ehrlichii]